MDKEILYTYSINTDAKPRIQNLARKLGMPRWAIYQRALKIGAIHSSQQKRPWKEEEISLLKSNARYEPLTKKRNSSRC